MNAFAISCAAPFLVAEFASVRVFRFPDGCRRFGEVVVMGTRRKDGLTDDEVYRDPRGEEEEFAWTHTWTPKYLPSLDEDSYKGWYPIPVPGQTKQLT